MRHVDPEDGTDFVRNGPHPLIIPFTGISGSTADDEFGFAFQRLALHLIIIDHARLLIQAVGHGMVQDAGRIDRRTVGEMPALGEVQAHEGVARTQASHGHCHVGLGAGMRLDVGPFRPVDLLDPVDGDLLDLVDHFAASVVALARVAFRVFVGQHGAHRLANVIAHVILGRDEFQAGRLPFPLPAYQFEDLKILFHTFCV